MQHHWMNQSAGTANWIPATNAATPQGEGWLLLRFERPCALELVAATLRRARFCLQRADEVLSVKVAGHQMARLVRTLSETLSPLEQSAIRVIWEALGQAMSLRDCFDVSTLREWLARAQGDWFLEMLRDERFEAHFQPIVSVESPSQIYGYESLLRGVTPQGLVAPLPLFEVAGNLKMRAQLDAKARQNAICQAGKLGLDSRLFLNCLPSALDDAHAALCATLNIVNDAGLKREQIVLEIIETECIEDAGALRDGLELFRRAGFGVALDDLGAGYASLQLLEKLRPDFVKLDRELIAGVDADPFKAVIAEKLLETARHLGIQTVAEGVETAAQWNWLRAHGGELAQGFFFARPAALLSNASQWERVASLN